jgi:hypothetical protein
VVVATRPSLHLFDEVVRMLVLRDVLRQMRVRFGGRLGCEPLRDVGVLREEVPLLRSTAERH